MEKKKKNLAWLIVLICVSIIFVPMIIFNTVLSIKAALYPNKLPSIFGIAPTAVMTGSMQPTIKANDLIFVKKVDADTLTEDNIICFQKDGIFIVHRIERIEEVNGVKRYYTKGDANNTGDSGCIVAEQIQGEYTGRIAGLGKVILFLQDPMGMILIIILLVLLYFTAELLIEYIATMKENKKLIAELELLKNSVK